MVGNFSLTNYYVVYIEDENFFFKKSNYDYRFWHTTRTYLIVSENKLKTNLIWPHIQRLWEQFKVFKISLLHTNDLRVLRIFNGKFHKYTSTRRLNYEVDNVKKYPFRVVVFQRMPSIVCNNGVCTGPDWETMQLFIKKMNSTLKIKMVTDETGFGRLMFFWILLKLFLLLQYFIFVYIIMYILNCKAVINSVKFLILNQFYSKLLSLVE